MKVALFWYNRNNFIQAYKCTGINAVLEIGSSRMRNKEKHYEVKNTKIIYTNKMNREPKKERENIESQERHKQYKLCYAKQETTFNNINNTMN